MYSFNRFIKEKYINWNNILSEGNLNNNFDEDDNRFVHKFNIPYISNGKKKSLNGKVYINHTYDETGNNHLHNVNFDIDDDFSRKEPESDEENLARMKFLEHIGKTVHSYVHNKILPHHKDGNSPRQDKLIGYSVDSDPTTSKLKEVLYKRYGKSLANKTGGMYSNYSTGFGIKYGNRGLTTSVR